MSIETGYVQVDQFWFLAGTENFLATAPSSMFDKTTGCDGILSEACKVLVTKDEGIYARPWLLPSKSFSIHY